MAEEFEESEIFQQNSDGEEGDYRRGHSNYNNSQEFKNKIRSKRKKNNYSVPVNIPENATGNPWFQYVESDFFEDEYEESGGEIVPPHVITSRRIAGKMAFSVCTGNGRTLKGRDLSEMRNAILKMTGFLEA